MGIPDHLTCLLRKLYAGQEAKVRTRCGTTDWFQIGKGVHQGFILSPCLFNFYEECCCSVTQPCPTLCYPMNCSTLGLPVTHHLLKFAQVQVHWVVDTIKPSHPLTLSSLSALILSQQSISQLFTSYDQNTWTSASVLSMSVQGLFFLRFTGLIWLAKGLSGVLSSTTVQRHQLFGTLPSL